MNDCSLGARKPTPPPLPTDRVRLHVAMWNLARALGLNWTTVDASRTDEELLRDIEKGVTPALARAFREGYELKDNVDADSNHQNPYDGIDM